MNDLSLKIASRWQENTLKKIDVRNKIKNFYAALLDTLRFGHRVIQAWDSLPPLVQASYPKGAPPLKDYIRDLTTWTQRMRNNMRAFAVITDKREKERMEKLLGESAYGKYALNNPQSRLLLNFALSLQDMDATWKDMHTYPMPDFVKEYWHIDRMPGTIHKQRLILDWAKNSGEAIRGDFMNKQAMAVRIAARWQRKMEADPRVLNFYEALQATTQAGFQLQKILKGHPQEELVLNLYPTSIPPFYIYVRALDKWRQAQRNAIRAFTWEGSDKQASPPSLDKYLVAYGIAMKKLAHAFKELYAGQNKPAYVQQGLHLRGMGTNPVNHDLLVRMWAKSAVEAIKRHFGWYYVFAYRHWFDEDGNHTGQKPLFGFSAATLDEAFNSRNVKQLFYQARREGLTKWEPGFQDASVLTSDKADSQQGWFWRYEIGFNPLDEHGRASYWTPDEKKKVYTLFKISP